MPRDTPVDEEHCLTCNTSRSSATLPSSMLYFILFFWALPTFPLGRQLGVTGRGHIYLLRGVWREETRWTNRRRESMCNFWILGRYGGGWQRLFSCLKTWRKSGRSPSRSTVFYSKVKFPQQGRAWWTRGTSLISPIKSGSLCLMLLDLDRVVLASI